MEFNKHLDKPRLDDCYICWEQIEKNNVRGGVLLYKCRHPICISCAKHMILFNVKCIGLCGICRADLNMYLVNSGSWNLVPYSTTQSIYVPSASITNDNFYSDHVQRLMAYNK